MSEAEHIEVGDGVDDYEYGQEVDNAENIGAASETAETAVGSVASHSDEGEGEEEEGEGEGDIMDIEEKESTVEEPVYEDDEKGQGRKRKHDEMSESVANDPNDGGSYSDFEIMPEPPRKKEKNVMRSGRDLLQDRELKVGNVVMYRYHLNWYHVLIEKIADPDTVLLTETVDSLIYLAGAMNRESREVGAKLELLREMAPAEARTFKSNLTSRYGFELHKVVEVKALGEDSGRRGGRKVLGSIKAQNPLGNDINGLTYEVELLAPNEKGETVITVKYYDLMRFHIDKLARDDPLRKQVEEWAGKRGLAAQFGHHQVCYECWASNQLDVGTCRKERNHQEKPGYEQVLEEMKVEDEKKKKELKAKRMAERAKEDRKKEIIKLIDDLRKEGKDLGMEDLADNVSAPASTGAVSSVPRPKVLPEISAKKSQEFSDKNNQLMRDMKEKYGFILGETVHVKHTDEDGCVTWYEAVCEQIIGGYGVKADNCTYLFTGADSINPLAPYVKFASSELKSNVRSIGNRGQKKAPAIDTAQGQP